MLFHNLERRYRNTLKYIYLYTVYLPISWFDCLGLLELNLIQEMESTEIQFSCAVILVQGTNIRAVAFQLSVSQKLTLDFPYVSM